MSRTQRAVIYSRVAALSEPFGRELFTKKFGEQLSRELMGLLGTYRSGPRKGEQRGYLHWKKCDVGGWCVDETGHGRVQRPGSYGYRLTLGRDPMSPTVAHYPDALGGPNDQEKASRILAAAREVLTREAA